MRIRNSSVIKRRKIKECPVTYRILQDSCPVCLHVCINLLEILVIFASKYDWKRKFNLSLITYDIPLIAALTFLIQMTL